MAMSDYHACDNCGAKTFYDANLSGFTGPNGEWLYGTEGIVGHRAYALCVSCEQTHEIRIVAKEADKTMGKYDELVGRLRAAAHVAMPVTPSEADYALLSEAATAITTLEAELAAMKARGNRLAEALLASRDWLAAENGNEAVALSRLEARIGQALTEWRDQ